tara:strand:- start:8676 stop:9905 length:1230 start_codon:yes stop_codon:yes gene_type:complete
MKNLIYKSMLLSLAIFVFSCDSDDDNDNQGGNTIVAPSSYEFTRNGASTVSFGGQTTRLNQAEELYSALNSNESTASGLDLMFNGDGNGSAGFADESLNGTSKIIGSKTSASTLAGSAATKQRFDDMISDYAANVVPNWNQDASAGVPGAISTPDGGSTYHLNAAGQELDQLFFKGLIGAFTLDQIVNNYIHPNQLDSGSRIDDNDNDVLSGDNNYTDMEHKWDEGFGYLYGLEGDNLANAGASPSGNGSLLMKYFKKVDEEGGYEPGIGQVVYDAFIMGRTAIVNKDYELRDQQAAIIKVELSKVIGYYAIHYMNDYVAKLEAGNVAKAHHSLSEAWGFLLSLSFTNNGNDEPFMDRATVEYFLDNYLGDFHSVNPGVLTAPATAQYPGMIALVLQAFEANGVTLNIS